MPPSQAHCHRWKSSLSGALNSHHWKSPGRMSMYCFGDFLSPCFEFVPVPILNNKLEVRKRESHSLLRKGKDPGAGCLLSVTDLNKVWTLQLHKFQPTLCCWKLSVWVFVCLFWLFDLWNFLTRRFVQNEPTYLFCSYCQTVLSKEALASVWTAAFLRMLAKHGSSLSPSKHQSASKSVTKNWTTCGRKP